MVPLASRDDDGAITQGAECVSESALHARAVKAQWESGCGAAPDQVLRDNADKAWEAYISKQGSFDAVISRHPGLAKLIASGLYCVYVAERSGAGIVFVIVSRRDPTVTFVVPI